MALMISLALTSGSKETSLQKIKPNDTKEDDMYASVRVYLKESIEEEEGFGPSGPLSAKFYGSKLGHKKDFYCVTDFNLDDKLPKKIRKHLHHITVWASFFPVPSREQGIYRYGGVWAHLGFVIGNKNSAYELEMNGQSIKQLRNTYEAIREGTRRPTISFEGEQQGKSKQELEAEIKQLKDTIVTLRDCFESVASAYAKISNAEVAIVYKMSGRRKEKDIVKKITELIHSAQRDIRSVIVEKSLRRIT